MGEISILENPFISEVPYEDQIQKVYIAYYQRPADPEGLLYWSQKLSEVNGDLSGIINAFANSAESQALYGGKTVEEIFTEIYQAAFNRDPDPEGLAWYTEKINLGEYSLTDVMLRVLDGAIGDDRVILEKKVEVAKGFTHILDPDLDGKDWTFDYRGEEVAQEVREWYKGVISSADASVPGLEDLEGMMEEVLPEGMGSGSEGVVAGTETEVSTEGSDTGTELNEGLILHYTFDDLEHVSVDVSGHNNDGIVDSGILEFLSDPGICGNSLLMESKEYAYMFLPDTSIPPIEFGGGIKLPDGVLKDSFTLNVWIKSNGSLANIIHVSKMSEYGSFEVTGFDVSVNETYIDINADGFEGKFLNASDVTSDNSEHTFHMYTIVRDVHNKIDIYMDGQYVDNMEDIFPDNYTKAIFAYNNYIASISSPGIFEDELQIWNRPLTSEEIHNLYEHFCDLIA